MSTEANNPAHSAQLRYPFVVYPPCLCFAFSTCSVIKACSKKIIFQHVPKWFVGINHKNMAIINTRWPSSLESLFRKSLGSIRIWTEEFYRDSVCKCLLLFLQIIPLERFLQAVCPSAVKFWPHFFKNYVFYTYPGHLASHRSLRYCYWEGEDECVCPYNNSGSP